MKKLQALLQARAEKIQNQRSILDKAKAENRDLTDDEVTQFDNLDAEIVALDEDIEKVKKQNEREQKLASREKELDQPAVKPFRSNIVPGPAPAEHKDNAGFESLGEFVASVRFGDKKGRLENMEMGTGESGGFMVPEQFREQLLQLKAESAIIRPRAQEIPAGDPPDSKITIPAFKQGADGAFGGVQVQWIEEGGDKPETSGKLQEISLEPKEVAGTVVVTDKLLRNWKAASSFLSNLLRGAMSNAEDLAFIKGDGVGKPKGLMSSPGALTVNRATANKISYVDTVNMVAKLLPESEENALWLASRSALPQIMTMQDPAGHYMYNAGDASKGIPATLAGIPIKWTGKTSVLGSKGDLVLVDLNYYLIKDGSGPYVAASEHVLFRQNKTVIKCFWNVDGQGWVAEPLTLEDGATKVSPYIILDLPAV